MKLIDMKKVLSELCLSHKDIIYIDKNETAERIRKIPSIDIEPKRGEWKPFDLTWGRSIWYCTACEESTEVPCDIWEHKPIYKYCPNCGARMKGADDEID